MFLRFHRSGENSEVVGICDKELIGTTLVEGDLSVYIDPRFFGDTQVTEQEVLSALKTSNNINMFGERCISIAIENRFVDREFCRIIAGVPHVIIL
jgi:hypothetical protein